MHNYGIGAFGLFFPLGVFFVLSFVSFGFRSLRFVRSAVRRCGWWVFPFLLPLCCLLSPVWLSAFLLRSACFVRFARPSAPPLSAWSCVAARRSGRWVCVSSARLSSVLSSSGFFCWSVVPAVVRRRLGVVSFFWVFVAPAR